MSTSKTSTTTISSTATPLASTSSPNINDKTTILPRTMWGTKRECLACGTRYYDFKANNCPECNAKYSAEEFFKSRKFIKSSTSHLHLADLENNPKTEDMHELEAQESIELLEDTNITLNRL